LSLMFQGRFPIKNSGFSSEDKNEEHSY